VIRVLVADDQTLVRAGFRVLVESAPDLEVVGEAGTGWRRSSWPAGSCPTWC
jgi:DNA-binding NarL/FixJ family response regulator